MPSEAPPQARVYEPHGGIREAIHAREIEVLVEGPAGTGKTMGDCHKANAVANKYPGSRQLFIRKTRASMTESVLVTFENKVLGPAHPLVANGPKRAHRHSYDYPNGSSIIVGGMDNPDRVLSTEYDRIYEFEAIEFQEDEHEVLITRLARNAGEAYPQIVSETNPGHPSHWLNRRANAGNMRRIVTRHRDNPYLWDHANNRATKAGETYLGLLDRLSGHRRARLRDGKWAASEGLVYPEFDIAVHRIDAMPPGWEKWPKRRAIDFGFVDPFVCQWWARNDGAWYLYREIYMSERTVAKHAAQIKRLSGDETYEATVTDHDAEDRETLHENGIDTTPAEKDISRGIDAVKSCLQRGANGKPRLYFLRDALVERDAALVDSKRPASTLEEFDAYLYKQHRDGVKKDEPVDRDNHGMDTLRYHIMGDSGGVGPCIGAAFDKINRPDSRLWKPMSGHHWGAV